MSDPIRTPAIYARQSVDKENSLSIEGQIELCRRLCPAGVEPAVFFDKGYSGKNTARPEFQKLMTAVRAGKIGTVYCYRLDRISRSIVDFGGIWEELSAHNVEFCSVSERFDTSTPTGRAMLYIIMVFAQLERETISERIKDNYYQRSRRGLWPGGPAPVGFEIQKLPDAPGSRLVPTDRIALIPEVFARYLAFGGSLGSVARWLTAEQIPTPSGRGGWDSNSVARLLHQPAYVRADASVYAYYKRLGLIMANGIDEFDGVHGCIVVGKRDRSASKYNHLRDHVFALCGHEGVISSDVFLSAQRKLSSNKQIANTGKGKYTWLSGLLKCASCGYGLSLQGGSGPYRDYLRCSGHFNLRVCDELHHENVHDVEQSVLLQMQTRLHGLFDMPTADEPDRLPELRTTVANADARISNLISALAEASPVTMSYINAEIARLEAEKEKALEQLQDRSASYSALQRIASLDLSSLDFDEKKAVANLMISRVLCSDTTVSVEWQL